MEKRARYSGVCREPTISNRDKNVGGCKAAKKEIVDYSKISLENKKKIRIKYRLILGDKSPNLYYTRSML